MTAAAYMRAYRAGRSQGFGPLVPCACGCGATFRRFNAHKRPRLYVQGHNSRGQHYPKTQEQRARIGAGVRKNK